MWTVLHTQHKKCVASELVSWSKGFTGESPCQYNENIFQGENRWNVTGH